MLVDTENPWSRVAFEEAPRGNCGAASEKKKAQQERGVSGSSESLITLSS